MAVEKTGLFTYDLDTPSDDHRENVRLGYRVPAAVLLPPYLMGNPYFLQYMEAVDEVFGPMVDEKIEILRNLRNMWPTDPDLEASIAQNALSTEQVMLDNSQWPKFERNITVKQVNALGMNLQSAGLITDDQYQAISRWAGQYWFGKGTQSFIDFINYCLNIGLFVQPLWTQDYSNFLPEGDPGIGTAIWDGGTWYPTSHVTIEAPGGLPTTSPNDLALFFYEIANYNLVLQAVDLRFDLRFVTDLHQNQTSAAIVAMGLWADNVVVMANGARFGWNQPPTQDLGSAIPTSGLISPSATNYQLMSAPSSWANIDGMVVPVYSESSRVATTGPDVPTTVCGPAVGSVPASGFTLLYGPDTWVAMPNSGERNTARLPGFSSTPVSKAVSRDSIPTTIVGAQRAFILCNPDGFADVSGTGYLTPYWNP